MAYTTIDDPSAYFKVQLWTGDDVDPRTITFDDTDTDMAPDFIWIKLRTVTHAHKLYDTVRGVNERHLVSDEDSAETTGQAATGYMTATTSDGFTIAKGSGTWWNGNTSTLSSTYVAWCWKESATAGFDIVTYTGNATDDTDISHNLSAVPHLIIVKNLGANEDWNVYHQKNTSAPETDYLVLNDQDATADAADRWSDEVPTSSVFTIGDNSDVNQDATGFVAYCFAEKQGYSKFGGYTGNGSTSGPMIWLGFKPSFIIAKRSDASGYDWTMMDSKRSPFNEADDWLYPNLTAVEDTNGAVDFLSNGFKIRQTHSYWNTSGASYIYMAFAEAPFVNSNGVPCTAR